MLSQKYRFHSRGGVRYVYQKGRTIRTPIFALIHAPNIRHRQRFAVVVSKKVLKHAVDRNRIRRRVYEAIRLEFPQYRHLTRDFIFIVYNKSVRTMPFADLRATIHDLLDRASAASQSSQK